MVTVKDIYRWIDDFAPFDTAMSFDNVGLLVGDADGPVTVALLALDITPQVIQQAVGQKAELIISHHPVIFQSLRRLSSSSVPYLLAQNSLCAIAAHTNYDLACGGVNTCLAERIGLQKINMLEEYEQTGLAASLIGELEQPLTPEAFAAHIKSALQCGGVKFTMGKTAVKTVAVACGAGSSSVFAAGSAKADAFVTGESKHHELLAAVELGLTMVDAGHFATENLAMQPLCDRLTKAFPQVSFLVADQQDPVHYCI